MCFRLCNLLSTQYFLINGIFYLICICNVSFSLLLVFTPFFLFASIKLVYFSQFGLILDHSVIALFHLYVVIVVAIFRFVIVQQSLDLCAWMLCMKHIPHATDFVFIYGLSLSVRPILSFYFDWEWCVLNGKRWIKAKIKYYGEWCIFLRKLTISNEGLFESCTFMHAFLQKSIRHIAHKQQLYVVWNGISFGSFVFFVNSIFLTKRKQKQQQLSWRKKQKIWH